MLEPKQGDNIVVWFSCGAANAVAWHETLLRYGNTCNVLAIYNPVIEEDSDNWRFGYDVCEWLRAPCMWWTPKKYPSASAKKVWEDRKAMSFPKGAPCTNLLKKAARREFEQQYRVDWHVLGFTADEEKRYRFFQMGERENTLPILLDAKIDKQGCVDRLLAEGIRLPRMYELGYPNANCPGCVKATSPTYWNRIRQTHPEVFADRAEQSRRLGVRLVRVKNKRIFLDELDPEARGRPLKSLKLECGIFCEEDSDA